MWTPVVLAFAAIFGAAPAAAASCGEEIALLARQYGFAPSDRTSGATTAAPRADAKSGSAEAPLSGSAALGPEKRSRMQSLIDEARAAEAAGREAECFERLGEARAIPEPG